MGENVDLVIQKEGQRTAVLVVETPSRLYGYPVVIIFAVIFSHILWIF